ncbi:MAG TPA: mannose-1-phosphate guanylyltransferase [Planctomycetaceae bacterium]|nr:mannose-1-phosphate guanylyltransferase [Planctomycetaceae bacterium]
MLHAVIMAGGAGTRFWPASRRDVPKQLLALAGQRTMIQATVDRLSGLVDPENILIVTNERLVSSIQEQLPHLPPDSIVGEPCKRDTAPCVGFAAEWVAKNDPDAIMAVMPADHTIGPEDVFRRSLQRAQNVVEEAPERFVTFGIPPTYAASTYGYIERGDSVDGGEMPLFNVSSFREKPDTKTAESFLKQGGFYWNSGIFVWSAQTILNALAEYEPEMRRELTTIAESLGTPQFESTFKDRFAAIRGKSIDYAVMERYPHVTVLEAPFAWDDVGSWRSLSRLHEPDANGNTLIGRHLGIGTEDCIVRTSKDHLVVTLGLKNCIVVHTEDATFVADKNDEEAVRQIVARLDELGWHEFL